MIMCVVELTQSGHWCKMAKFSRNRLLFDYIPIKDYASHLNGLALQILRDMVH